jgi:hypothetical protein
MIEGHLKAMRDYLANAETFHEGGEIKLTRENLIMLRDELYDALSVLGGQEDGEG